MIFISFLGTGNYLACNYTHREQRCDNVTFVQTAIRTLLAAEASESFIFVTKQAEEKHLANLQTEAADNGLPAMTPVSVPDGASEEQLWEIFQILSEKIPQGEEIIFDITHSFRSLPMLMTILLNYLGVVKQTTVWGCYYGAFEKLGNWKQVKEMDVEERDAPVFDLTPFFALNEWSRAIDDFMQYGHAEKLVDKVEGVLIPLIKSSPQERDNAITLRQAMRSIAKFSTYVHSANLHGLCALLIDKDITQRLNVLADIDSAISLAPALRPLEKLRSFFTRYENQSLRNGVRAALWCAKINLIPQGFTMLQESIVSLEEESTRTILEESGVKDELKRRKFLSALLGLRGEVTPDKWNSPLSDHKEAALKIRQGWSEEFLAEYDRITSYRNSLNHGGTNPASRISDDIGTNLQTLAEATLARYSKK